MDHTVWPANYTMPAFTRWRIHSMWWRTSNCSSLLIYRPRVDERLSWPGWLTYSGWLTHISGHPSATGQAQDGKKNAGQRLTLYLWEVVFYHTLLAPTTLYHAQAILWTSKDPHLMPDFWKNLKTTLGFSYNICWSRDKFTTLWQSYKHS